MHIPYAEGLNQSAGRPSWQKELPPHVKREADRLLNKAVLSQKPADIEQWTKFAEFNGAK